MNTMKDLRGTTISVGDFVEYFVGGDIDNSCGALFVVKEISLDSNKLADTTTFYGGYRLPFATLARTGDGVVLSSPFFSHEVRKPEPEELI